MIACPPPDLELMMVQIYSHIGKSMHSQLPMFQVCVAGAHLHICVFFILSYMLAHPTKPTLETGLISRFAGIY